MGSTVRHSRRTCLAHTDVPYSTAWVEKGGVVGRGVLLDYASWAEANNIAIDYFSPNSISADALQEIATSQGTDLRRGDILLIRSGWTKAFSQLSDEQATVLASHSVTPAAGIESSEKTLRWLWGTGFAAIAGDMPSLEAWPCQNLQFWLHEWLLAGWGMPIGELFDLERLSEECKSRGRWSFFFSSMPLRVSLIRDLFSAIILDLDIDQLALRFLGVLLALQMGWLSSKAILYVRMGSPKDNHTNSIKSCLCIVYHIYYLG